MSDENVKLVYNGLVVLNIIFGTLLTSQIGVSEKLKGLCMHLRRVSIIIVMANFVLAIIVFVAALHIPVVFLSALGIVCLSPLAIGFHPDMVILPPKLQRFGETITPIALWISCLTFFFWFR